MAYDRLARALIKAESGGRRYAQNPRSTAGGPAQFLDGTWLEMIKRHRPDIAAGKSDAEILALKTDPGLSGEMTQRYAQDNAGFLKSRGIEPTPDALSLAHFAGPGGAAAVYSDPNETVRSLLGDEAVAANPFLKGKTGRDLIDWAGKRISPGKATAARLRQRYSGGETGKDNAPRADAPADPKARLRKALGGSFDPKAVDRASGLVQAGQKIAGRGDPLSAIGGTILAGLGGYQKSKEDEARRAYEKRFAESLQGARDPAELARALIASPDEKMRAAGIQLYAQSMGPKSAPTTKTVTVGKDKYGRPIERNVVWDAQEGRWKPMDLTLGFEGDGQQEAPQTTSQPPQTGIPPQAPTQPAPAQTPPQRPETASDGPIIRDLPDASGQTGTGAPPAPGQPEPQTSGLPEGMESGPLAGKDRVGEGFIHKPAPGGGYLWQQGQDGQLSPVLESEEAAKLSAKADAEKQANKSKIWGQVQSMEQTHSVVQDDIQRALDNYLETGSWPETGMFAYLSYVPGTSAYDLSQLLQTIKANIGFDKLQEMRENSPTGGALGQVSNLELTALQSVLGSMDQFQTGEQLKANLMRLSEILEKSGKRRREAYKQDFGGIPESMTTDDQEKEGARSGPGAILQKARDAIAAGADRGAVIERLREAGIEAEGL